MRVHIGMHKRARTTNRRLPELSKAAGAFRGELLGLLAIHLILLAINTIKPDFSGLVKIYSNCLGALGQVTKLPENRIPS